MTFLPIVERELRVAARRKGTYWSRLGASALAVFILAAVLGIAELGRGTFGLGGQLGLVLFNLFSWLSFAFVCAAGVFLTADSLSEEKREGTLGLLFLTDLRGYDVVLGKLFSHALVAAYGLLAAFPVIGIAFLLGGVTGGEFWRLMLVLFNTLFFSLTTGVFVSSISRDPQRAMSGAAFLGGLFLIVLPLIDWAMADWDGAKFEAWFSLASAGYGLTEARSMALTNFWNGLMVVHVLAWVFLIAASLLAPRQWQEASAKSVEGSRSRGQRWRFGAPLKRAALRVQWLAENPVCWLAGRDLWMGRFLWLALAGFLVGAGMMGLGRVNDQVLIGLGSGALQLFRILLNLWVATYATRFFVDAMRTGTIELLLATPLEPKQVIRGQWWAIRRTFAGPILIIVLLEIALGCLQVSESIRSVMKNSPATLKSDPEFAWNLYRNLAVSEACSIVVGLTSLIAVAWFGMWMGLISKKANQAVIKTIAFVQVLPFIALAFAQIAMQMLFAIGGGINLWWLTQVISAVFAVIVDIAFIRHARKRLFNSLREVAAQASGDGVAVGIRWPKFGRRGQGVVDTVA